VKDGQLKGKDKIRLMATHDEYVCEQLGVFTPKSVPMESLSVQTKSSWW